MENRINQLFKEKRNNILSVYFTAGYPNLQDTEEIIVELEKSGADLIEIGIPFSDPVADGPTIQKSSDKALKNGMSMKLLFGQLKDIRQKVKLPLVLMGYFNNVLQYGVEDFCRKANEIGVDGIILPDLPLEVYENEYRNFFEQNNLRNIFLITPRTSDARIRKIDDLSSGFIYMVSSSSTTGAKSSVTKQQESYFKRIKEMNLKNPRLVGFGISDNTTFVNSCRYSNGAIVGSAFIKALSNEGPISQNVKKFVDFIRLPEEN
ncbi:tryptophan synthase subunit alpha [Prolixibacter sp. SD074]|jgi:tryptophan synthase alpha chain|uniref:tryptophan synthase subunit alpha n=1 Tax=Prolixibacter sp. SD074 TaxID=2652391 RepID=UPI001278EF4B|nr:tryptophan synthase subunit alpha [Prolixibacter sp. SD074]GET30263.1 tryptophan synthase alpha chain [Prolixibacter sp. SD074]